jgi:hypothetical protein
MLGAEGGRNSDAPSAYVQPGASTILVGHPGDVRVRALSDFVGGAGKLNAGRYVDVGRGIHKSNLFVTMLNKMGVEIDKFGDSTGRFDYI